MATVRTLPPAPVNLSSEILEISPDNNVDSYLSTMKLSSNGTPISSSALGRLQSHSKDTPIDELRAFYEEHGYLLVKNLLPPDVVRAMRRKYFEFVSPSGILKEGTSPEEGIYCGAPPAWYTGLSTSSACGDSDPHAKKFLELTIEAHKADWYMRFSDHPALLEFTKRLTGWKNVQLLQRQLLRSNVPGQECTAVHYDQIFLRAGEPTFLTAWVPIGHVTPKGGALIYLEKSFDLAEKIEEEFSMKSQEMTNEERISAFNAHMMRGGMLSFNAGEFGKVYERRWLVADYEDGDVIFHNPYMIHVSVSNESPEGRIRLATDLRFVNTDKPWDKRWMKHWTPADGL